MLTIYLFFYFLLCTSIAFADSDPAANGVQWVINQLNGTLGIALATLAVISMGLLCLGNYLEWKRLLQTIMGIAIIFGASALVNAIRSAVGH